MAYRFEPDENAREAIARCAREQLDRGIRALSEEVDDDPVRAVHSARKAIKKERALLRLGRGTLARQQRTRENAALRGAARRLSGTRDAEVMVQTLDALSERFAGQLPDSTFAAVRQHLDRARRSERARLAESSLSSEVVQDLVTVRARMDDWRLVRDGWRAIEAGLLSTYGRGHRAFQRAAKKPSLQNLHDWRKRVKDLSYQLRLLAPVCGPALRGHAKEAGQLAELLGENHDLGVLRKALRRIAPDVAVDIDALLGLVDYRRSELEIEAMYAGRRVYAEETKAFGRRIHRRWKAGQPEIRAVREAHPAELAEVTRSLQAA